jgi:transposase
VGIPEALPLGREDGIMDKKQAGQKRYPSELKERAVRMVLDLQPTDPHDENVISRVARQLGVGSESLRTWVKQAQIDAGQRPGPMSEEQVELTRLRKENRELRRANDILQASASFFGAELDRRHQK